MERCRKIRIPLLFAPVFILGAFRAGAQPYTVLHRFAADASEGSQISAPVVLGNDGNYYGVALHGGAGGSNYGTAFRVTPGGVFTKLHDFTGAADGGYPLVLVTGGSSDDNLYGLTQLAMVGGTTYTGTFFRMSEAGTVTTLFDFSSLDGNLGPATLIRGTDGNFYGTASNGGVQLYGTAFRLSSAGAFTKLHDFGPSQDPNGTYPTAIGEGTDLNFYGVVQGGGANLFGGIFTLGTGSSFSLLHSVATGEAAAGGNTSMGLVLLGATDGNVYGAASVGCSQYAAGCVWRMTPAGAYSIAHAFQRGEGIYPYSGVIEASDGNIYGATSGGPTSGVGTLYQLTPSGSFTTIHAFAADADGQIPYASPIQGPTGRSMEPPTEPTPRRREWFIGCRCPRPC